MEKVVSKEQGAWKALWPALLVVGLACAMVAIAYGLDSVAPGVHDAYHDFRHTIGIPCH